MSTQFTSLPIIEQRITAANSINKLIEIENTIMVKLKFDKKIAFCVYDEFTEDEQRSYMCKLNMQPDIRLQVIQGIIA